MVLKIKNFKNNFFSFVYRDPIVKKVKRFIVDLPRPKNISYFWKFGSLLGLFLVVQLISGIFLSTYYVSDLLASFKRVDIIMRETNYLWIFRKFHIVGASFYFLFIFFHVGRGIYYSSWKQFRVWFFGTFILILSMLTAFLGYVLPWGQMSYWGATVITKLLSAVPFVGKFLVLWIWGGFAVGGSTLTRFFSLHFLFPFIVIFLVVIHLVYLHEKGSTNPLELRKKRDKINFFPYFVLKDVIGFFFILLVFSLRFIFPKFFVEREKFFISKALVTPIHIQPEWYFLAAYAILRRIPNKLRGVLALVFSVVIVGMLIILSRRKYLKFKYSFSKVFFFWLWIFNFFFLTWLGSMVVEPPFIFLRQVCGFFYFFLFILYCIQKLYK